MKHAVARDALWPGGAGDPGAYRGGPRFRDRGELARIRDADAAERVAEIVADPLHYPVFTPPCSTTSS